MKILSEEEFLKGTMLQEHQKELDSEREWAYLQSVQKEMDRYYMLKQMNESSLKQRPK